MVDFAGHCVYRWCMHKKTDTCGARIAAARRRAGLTLQALADKIGVSKQAVSLWEADDRSPHLDNLRAIAVALDVPVHALIGEAS